MAICKEKIYVAAKWLFPIGSMYGIFTYIWLILILMVNVGKNTSPMDPMGLGMIASPESPRFFKVRQLTNPS